MVLTRNDRDNQASNGSDTPEAKKAILTMLRGAVVISDLYVQQATDQDNA